MVDFNFTSEPTDEEPGLAENTKKRFQFTEEPTERASYTDDKPQFNFTDEPTGEPEKDLGIGQTGKRLYQAVGKGAADSLLGAAAIQRKDEFPGMANVSPSILVEAAQENKRRGGKTMQDLEAVAREIYSKGAKTSAEALEFAASAYPEIDPRAGYNTGVAGFLEETGIALGQSAPSMAMMKFSGGLSVLAIFTQMKGQKYTQLKEKGLKEEDAQAGSDIHALMATPVEFMGNLVQFKAASSVLKTLGKNLGLGKKTLQVLGAVSGSGAGESIEEYTQAHTEVIADTIAENPKASPEEIRDMVWSVWKDPDFQKRAGYQAAQGATGGALLPGMAGAAYAAEHARTRMQFSKADWATYQKLLENPLITDGELQEWVANRGPVPTATKTEDGFSGLKKTVAPAPVDPTVVVVPTEQIASGISTTDVAKLKEEGAKEQAVVAQAQAEAKKIETQAVEEQQASEAMAKAIETQDAVVEKKLETQAVVDEQTRFNQAISTEDGFFREVSRQIQPVELGGTKEQKKVVKSLREMHEALSTDEGRPDRFRVLNYQIDQNLELLTASFPENPQIGQLASGLMKRSNSRIDLLELAEKREVAIKEEEKEAKKAEGTATPTKPTKPTPKTPIQTGGQFSFDNAADRQSLKDLGYTLAEIDIAERMAYMRKPNRSTKKAPMTSLREPAQAGPGTISIEQYRENIAKETLAKQAKQPQLPQDQRTGAEATAAIPAGTEATQEAKPGLPRETIVDRALKTKGGDVLTGKTVLGKPAALHAEIWEGLTHSTRMSLDRNQDGFITNTGRYVNRDQAKAEDLKAVIPKGWKSALDKPKKEPKSKPEPKQVQLGLFAKYDRSEPVKTHVTTRELAEGFQKVRINLAKSAPIIIMNSSRDLKDQNPELFNQMEGEGVHGKIKGVYDALTNTVYVFADMHQTVIDAKVTAWHEMGHFGILDLLGEGLNPTLDRVRSKYGKEVEEYLIRYHVPNTISERKRAVEEILIEKFQANKDLNVVQSVKSLVHALANRIGFEEVVTDAEVARLVQNVRENILEGRTEDKNNYWLVGHTQGEKGDKVYQIKRGPYPSRNAARKASEKAVGLIYSEAVKRGFKIVSMEKIGAEDYKYQRETYPANMHPRHENILHKVRDDIASGKIVEGSEQYAVVLKKHGAEIRGATIQHAPGVRFLVGTSTVYGPKQKGDTKTTVLKHNLYGPVEITTYKDEFGRDVTVGPIFSQDPVIRGQEIDEIVSRHAQDITWYTDWKSWMMDFTKAGIPVDTITKCIKIQALLSAGSGPRENQRYFARVIDALEAGNLKPGPLSRITEESKTQLGLFLNKGQTKGDIQKQTEVVGAGISAQVYPKIMEIWEGRDNYPTTPEKQAAYGEKVGAYLATALAPLEERTPVIDRHMPRPWGFNIMWSPKILEGGATWKVAPEVRDMITADIQASSDRTGVPVAGIQAAIWFEVRNEDVSSATYWEAAQEGMDFVPEMFQAVLTLEGQDAIHYSDKVLQVVKGSGLKESHNTYSRKDVGSRKAQITAEWPYIALGQFYSAGATPEPRFLTKVSHVAKVQPGTIYDGGMDLLRLWTKAFRTNEANSGTNTTNIFAKLVRDLGYLGFSHQVQGQTWVAFFGETPVVGPSTTQARLSDVINPDPTVPQDLTLLREIANERAGKLEDEIRSAFRQRYPEIKVLHSAPTLAHFHEATQSMVEYGLDLQIEGPMPSIKAAMSDIIGVGKAQRMVYIQGDTDTMGIAATGVNLRFKIKSDMTTSAVEIGLKKHGVTDYNLEATPQGLFIDQYFDGKGAVPAALGKFFDEYGEPGTAEQYDAALNVLDRNSYKDHIINHFGVIKGEKIYAKSYSQGQVHKITGGGFPSGISQEAVQGRNDIPAERGEGEDQPGTKELGKYKRVTVEEVMDLVNEIDSKIAVHPTFKVIDNYTQFPERIKDKIRHNLSMTNGLIEHSTQGADKAVIWIVAGAQGNIAHTRETMTHELLGHFGLHKMSIHKIRIQQFLQDLFDMKTEEVVEHSTRGHYNHDLSSPSGQRLAAEEWFAWQISSPTVLKTAWLNEMYDRLAVMFRQFFISMGIMRPLTDSEIRYVMLRSARAILKPEVGIMEFLKIPVTPEMEARRSMELPKYSRETVTIPGEVPTEGELLVNPTTQDMKDFIHEKPRSAIADEFVDENLGATPIRAFERLGWKPLRWMLVATPEGKPNLYAWDGYTATHAMMLRIIRRNWIDVVSWGQEKGDSAIEDITTQWNDRSTWRKPRQAMYSRASFRDNVSNEYPGLLEKMGVPNIGKEKEQATILARKIVERSNWKNDGPYKLQPEKVLSSIRKALMGDINGLEPWEQDAANQFLQEYRGKRDTTLGEPEGFLSTMPGVSPDTIGPAVHKKEDAATTKEFEYKYLRHSVPYTSSRQYAKDVAAGRVNAETASQKEDRRQAVEREHRAIEEVRNANPPPSMDMDFFRTNTREEQQLKLAAWQIDLQKKTQEAVTRIAKEERPLEVPAIPSGSTLEETEAAIEKWNSENPNAKYSRVSYPLPFPVETKTPGVKAKHFYYLLFHGATNKLNSPGTQSIMATSEEAARAKIMRTHGLSFLPDNTPVWERSLEEKEIFKYVDKPSRPKYSRRLDMLVEGAWNEPHASELRLNLGMTAMNLSGRFDPERNKVAKERADDMYMDTVLATINEFRKAAKGGAAIWGTQPWKKVKDKDVIRIWEDFADNGSVSAKNVKAMDRVWYQVVNSAMQVLVNTDLVQHRKQNVPRNLLQKYFGIENMSEAEQQHFMGWIRQEDVPDRIHTDVGHAMRTSDYGLRMQDVEVLLYAQTAEEKLVAVDRIFNLVHQRFEMADMFIEGGWKTLERLAGRMEQENMSPGELLKKNEQVFPKHYTRADDIQNRAREQARKSDLRAEVQSFDAQGGPAVGAARDWETSMDDQFGRDADAALQEEVNGLIEAGSSALTAEERERWYSLRAEWRIEAEKVAREQEENSRAHEIFLAQHEADKTNTKLSDAMESERQILLTKLEARKAKSAKYLYSEREIKDHIGMKDVKPGDNNRMGLSLFQKFTTQVFDSNLPRKVLEPKDLPAAMSGYKAASMISNLPAVMHAVFHEGLPQFESNWVKVKPENQGGLYTVFSRLGDKADNFFLWQTAKSAQELLLKGRQNIFGQEQTTGNQLDDQKMVDSINALVGPDYAANQKLWDAEEARLKEINDAILDFAEQANVIDPAQRQVWQRETYIPFNRVLDDDLWGTDIEQLFPKNPAAQVGTVFKLKGGKLNMGDPLMNLANTYSYLMQQSLKNLANGKTLNLALAAGLVHRIAPPPSGRVKAGEIQVRVSGESQYYKVLDPYLYDALIDMDLISGGTGNKWLDWLIHWPKVALTWGVTVAPAFRIANFIRDTLSTSFMSNSVTGVAAAGINFLRSFARSDEFREFASTGGAFTGAYHSRDNLADTAAGIADLKKDLTGGFDYRNPIDYAKFVLDVWNRVGEASENANRMRVYMQNLAEGKSVFHAAYEAKDLLDFHRTGKCAMLRYFTTMVPFLNARLQGLYKMGRTSVDDKTRLNFWLHALGLTLASLALHAHNRDDERYKALTDADKLLYWHFFDVPGIGHLKIPNPFEVGVMFAAMPVALVETLEGTRDGADLMRFIKRAAVNVFALDPTPQFAKPLLSQYYNQNTFTGQQIVPMGEQGIAAKEQYGPGTTTTARALGETLDVSPRRIDALVKDYFSYAGMISFYFTDMAVGPIKGYPEKAEEKVGDMNITGYGRFVKGDDPFSYTKAQEMFYDYLAKVEMARNTYRMYVNTKQLGKAREWKEENRELMKRAGSMGATQDAVGEINKKIKRIHANPNLTPAEKRLQLNEQTRKKNKLFEKALAKRRERESGQAD